MPIAVSPATTVCVCGLAAAGLELAGWSGLVTAGVDNLFNRAYAEHISKSTNAIPGYTVQSVRVSEPGRTLWLKASLSFGR